MNLSPTQSTAVDEVTDWFYSQDPQPIFRLFGCAGTGKTSIAKYIAEALGCRTLYAAYTGKAAYVLRQKGCTNAQTIHSLIYLPKSKCSERLRELREELAQEQDPVVCHTLRTKIDDEEENMRSPSFSLRLDSVLTEADLLIVDEVSMVSKDIAEDLLKFGVPILALGDPAQLPPVKGQGYFTDAQPDVMLTEIHRQARGNPILALATDIREGRGYGDTDMVTSRGVLDSSDMAKFDQVLVGTHKARQYINADMRKFFGFPEGIPAEGDRIICRRNDSETGLLNGSQWYVEQCIEEIDGRLDMRISSVEGDEELEVCVHPHPFRDEDIPYFEIREAQCFDWAYALTVHSAQGSEWASVCVIDEAYKFPIHTRRAWRYTAITRASENLTIVRH